MQSRDPRVTPSTGLTKNREHAKNPSFFRWHYRQKADRLHRRSRHVPRNTSRDLHQKKVEPLPTPASPNPRRHGGRPRRRRQGLLPTSLHSPVAAKGHCLAKPGMASGRGRLPSGVLLLISWRRGRIGDGARPRGVADLQWWLGYTVTERWLPPSRRLPLLRRPRAWHAHV
jgi:hypothetical protein